MGAILALVDFRGYRRDSTNAPNLLTSKFTSGAQEREEGGKKG
jgi:hypothetical protein